MSSLSTSTLSREGADGYRNPHDLFYLAKFDETGNVREGWSYTAWLEWWLEFVPKRSTRGCNSVVNGGQ